MLEALEAAGVARDTHRPRCPIDHGRVSALAAETLSLPTSPYVFATRWPSLKARLI
jgi:formate-dependent phosphoribosylglycinamide formyltransferase (GAR transformylase)